MDKVLIAGATGYLGYWMTEAFRRAGYAVTAVAKDHGEDAAAARLSAMGAEIAYVDASKRESFRQALGGASAVVSCMAAPGGGKEADGDFWAIDRDANIRLAREAADAGVKHFVLMATFEGPASRKQTEFSDAKEAAVDAARQIAAEKGMRFTVLRPNAYFKDLTNRAFDSVQRKGTYAVFGDGMTRINPVHGADVAELALKCVQGEMEGGGEYPVGGPDIFTFRGLGELAAEALGKRVTLEIRFIQAFPLAVMEFLTGLTAPFSRSARRRKALIGWMRYALSHDAVAPAYGKRRLIDEFREKAAASRPR